MSLKKLLLIGILSIGCNATVEQNRQFTILEPKADGSYIMIRKAGGDFKTFKDADNFIMTYNDGAFVIEIPNPVDQENRILRRKQETLNRQWEQDRILRGDLSQPSIKMDIQIEEDPYPPGPNEFKPH